jgi:hypothetical protein
MVNPCMVNINKPRTRHIVGKVDRVIMVR